MAWGVPFIKIFFQDGENKSIARNPYPRYKHRMSLKTIIDAQGRKQSWIADKLGIPPSTFHAIVHDKAKLPADQVVPLAALLGISAKAVLEAVERDVSGGAA